jgi:hypothetical protein
MEELSAGVQEYLGERSSDRTQGAAKHLQLADGSQAAGIHKVQLRRKRRDIRAVTLTSCRTRADIAFLEQAAQLADANVGIQAAIERLRQIEQTSQQNAEALMLNDEKILTVVETSAASNKTDHSETRAVVALAAVELREASTSNHDQTRDQITSFGIHVASAVETASEENMKQHEATREEMERVRLETEKQVRELREEIRLLKIGIEQSVQKVVASVGKISAREQQQLRELSNAKFNLWVAKEIMLKKLLVSGTSCLGSIKT